MHIYYTDALVMRGRCACVYSASPSSQRFIISSEFLGWSYGTWRSCCQPCSPCRDCLAATHHVASAKDGGPREAAAALRLACLLAVDEPALRDGTISQRAEEDRQSAART